MCSGRCATVRTKTEKRTVLFAPAKFANDLKGRFLQLNGEITRIPILHFAMTDEEEFAARSQLKWTREGDAWILLYRRRRTGP